MSKNNILQKISNFRREYTRSELRSIDLPSDPILLFEQWLNKACIAQLPDPTAMTIATVDSEGQPYQRAVLLKYYDSECMIFYTNLNSRKAQHLRDNPNTSLYFPWYGLERQVMILGKVEKLSPLEVLNYFRSRPRDSQIAAWVSKQSNKISTRSILEQKFFELKQKFQHHKVPLPSFWGGFRIKFHTIEFWQGGQHRLHDRFLYQRKNTSDAWKFYRLAP